MYQQIFGMGTIECCQQYSFLVRSNSCTHVLYNVAVPITFSAEDGVVGDGLLLQPFLEYDFPFLSYGLRHVS